MQIERAYKTSLNLKRGLRSTTQLESINRSLYTSWVDATEQLESFIAHEPVSVPKASDVAAITDEQIVEIVRLVKAKAAGAK